jgi:hypothetical protein
MTAREGVKWDHRAGDRYQAVVCQAWVNERGHGFSYHTAGEKGTHLHAKNEGFRAAESDDFNIAAIRDGRLVALLWMDQIVDDEPSELRDCAEQCGFRLGDETPGPTEEKP